MVNDELEVSTTPVTRLKAAARRLVSYWDEARLRVAQAKSASVRQAPGAIPWRAALEDILKVGYGIQGQSRFVDGSWERIRWRTTPSAGALYPYDVMACVVGEGCYLWDIDRGRLLRCGLEPMRGEDLASAGLATAPGNRLEALLVLVARPWLSMKKYSLRGYAYCHLDVGHAATNLAIYTKALGYTPTLHLRFSRSPVSSHLRLDGLCREPLAILSFAGAGIAAEPESGMDVEIGGLEPPEEPEILNWMSLQGLLSLDSPLEPPSVPAATTLLREPEGVDEELLVPLPAGRPQPAAAGEWHSAVLGRRSAKGFYDKPLTIEQIGALLCVLRDEGLPADCPPDGSARLGARLIARNVEDLAGVFAYAPRSHALHRIDGRADDFRPACMQQPIAANAAALLIFHAPVRRLFEERGYSGFTELLFRAAELGQRLHLAAARLGALGMTCVGGFDGEESAALARLAGEEEVAYVILLGIPNDAAFKHDRLKVAYSHGQTTLEE
ncbi:MAG TPA: nitroreductase family protein [Thermoanaerobaculia bacterium]|nr:nitroreductase family protein [Thermoanaerobaculia bacterium]